MTNLIPVDRTYTAVYQIQTRAPCLVTNFHTPKLIGFEENKHTEKLVEKNRRYIVF